MSNELSLERIRNSYSTISFDRIPGARRYEVALLTLDGHPVLPLSRVPECDMDPARVRIRLERYSDWDEMFRFKPGIYQLWLFVEGSVHVGTTYTGWLTMTRDLKIDGELYRRLQGKFRGILVIEGFKTQPHRVLTPQFKNVPKPKSSLNRRFHWFRKVLAMIVPLVALISSYTLTLL